MSTLPVIIYDGDCRFCLWSMGRIRKLARQGQFDYAPRQQPGLDERFPILAQSDFNTGLRLIQADGTVHVGADGVYQIYRRIRPFQLITWIYRVPLLQQLFRLGYAVIARNRHRIGQLLPDAACADDACTLSWGEKQQTDPRPQG